MTTSLPPAFIDAMNDDLGTPAAVAVIYQSVREGNQALDADDQDRVVQHLDQVLGTLEVLGLAADSPAWGPRRDDQPLSTVVDGLITELLKQRGDARSRRDFAAADAIRDSLTAMGVEISDTPRGSRWSLKTN